ncbi:transcriptional regulator ArsR family (plasmid) [Cupriavidus necator N-1]|jgi:rhodanese-related sulfurtransferase|uniref:Transcriptional regulator ArsR family n=1 Tax=Cupriavidus necator (strain ATCC 43291 / DSM 13513 / CCUG 52238 / LMG 8453 / N-1) TaxID=1042878 RepID=F8GV02_CUPNN|nr:metalloregulator ArsR/SmtB family transcription factor [Cupriavidus necator]AEI82556.1 transcriptional regulator ArsR family [Cupriavidus necator N-1]MDX6007555.1 metalloregulator ArsR/SmtB family transcription factor [Cupriavidus necator]
MRELKNHLYEQVARIGKAVASPKRLELIELLCQGEKTVEVLAAQAGISVKLASAHLKELRGARLAETRKDGKYVVYRLASTGVADLWVTLRSEAEERLVELQVALATIVEHDDDLQGFDRVAILRKARAGEVLVLDVRPADEFTAAHLPHARSLPLGELKKRLAEIPKDMPVVAYCRGPFCLMAKDAVEFLRSKGYHAFHLTDGVAEWRAHGLPIELQGNP